ncbi:hypothetical protein A2U01_0093552 [Trifolium medium]|uniref:Uncharacterized protein n=1 Tax=Trifolium medium TaxID=97028 RepID=A0A392UFG7_9FABA|nr:hypothetical protein [Trifolium medium]
MAKSGETSKASLAWRGSVSPGNIRSGFQAQLRILTLTMAKSIPNSL